MWLFSLCVIPFDSQLKQDAELSGAAEAAATVPFDVAGALIFALAMGLLLLAITKGNDFGWGSHEILACSTTSLAAFALLIFVERRATEAIFSRRLVSSPVVPLSIFLLMCTDVAVRGSPLSYT